MESIDISSIKGQIEESILIKESLLADCTAHAAIQRAVDIIVEAYQRGNKTILAGNGGSAADAQHIAGEFVSRFYFDRPALQSFALTTDSSVMTAIGNDYGFEKVFRRQLEACAKAGDIFIGISTSGNSENIVRAFEICESLGVKSIGLVGQSGGKVASLADIVIRIPSTETPRIQEGHILVGHIICALVELALFEKWKA